MEWLELHIDTNHAGLEPLEIFLSANGVDGVVIDDEQDFQNFLENNHQYWDYVDEELEASMKGKSRVTFYLEANDDGFAKLGQLRTALQTFKEKHNGKYGSLLMTMENLQDADWENNWKQYYKPFDVGQRLHVCPSWEQDELPEGRVLLTMDPASSFGTGSHATTRMCMEQLDQLELTGEKILDVGCGSGILACTALLLGGSHATACDIEENAMAVTAENMVKNHLGGDRYRTVCGDLLSDAALRQSFTDGGPYGVILANIVADVLMAMSSYLPGWLKDDGHLILSGIIDTRAQEVRDTFLRAGMVIENEIARDGWVMLCCKKAENA